MHWLVISRSTSKIFTLFNKRFFNMNRPISHSFQFYQVSARSRILIRTFLKSKFASQAILLNTFEDDHPWNRTSYYSLFRSDNKEFWQQTIGTVFMQKRPLHFSPADLHWHCVVFHCTFAQGASIARITILQTRHGVIVIVIFNIVITVVLNH